MSVNERLRRSSLGELYSWFQMDHTVANDDFSVSTNMILYAKYSAWHSGPKNRGAIPYLSSLLCKHLPKSSTSERCINLSCPFSSGRISLLQMLPILLAVGRSDLRFGCGSWGKAMVQCRSVLILLCHCCRGPTHFSMSKTLEVCKKSRIV